MPNVSLGTMIQINMNDTKNNQQAPRSYKTDRFVAYVSCWRRLQQNAMTLSVAAKSGKKHNQEIFFNTQSCSTFLSSDHRTRDNIIRFDNNKASQHP